MTEVFRFKPKIKFSNVAMAALICSAFLCDSLAAAPSENNLSEKEYRNNVLQKIADLVESEYVIPEKAKTYAEQFRKICESGAYDSYTDPKEFAAQVTSDLVRITEDAHIKFRLIESSDIGESTVSSLHHPVRYHRLGIKENKGFSKLEWMDGNIGYLDIRRFYHYPDVRELVIGAIRFLSNADAVIIDLRENGGGSGDYLSSFFLPPSTQLNSWYSRKDDLLTEYWTSEVTGVKPLVDVPLFLLTSERTFSAAESFAYDMQLRRRATIIGDPTRGGAHSVDLYKIDDRFEIYISTSRAINPVTGSNWEGAGVIPDIPVPSKSALDTALVLARKAGAEYAKAKETILKSAVEAMQIMMDRAEMLFRRNEEELASAALDSLFRIAEEHGMLNEFFMDVLAYNYYSSENEQILYAILEKKIEFFPESPPAHESLGYAYYRNKRRELAIACYEKVLEIDPGNRNASKMIERLRNE